MPQPVRRPAAMLAGLALLLLVALSACYHGAHSYGRLDSWFAASASPLVHWHARWSELIVWMGTASFVVPVAGALSVALLVMHRWRLAALAIAGPGLTGAVTTLMKPMIGRTIHGGLALPSGHTGGLTSVSIVVALMCLDGAGPRTARRAVAASVGVALVATAMAVSLTGLGIHYATDTVAGFCAAVTVCLTTASLIDITASCLRAYSGPAEVLGAAEDTFTAGQVALARADR